MQKKYNPEQTVARILSVSTKLFLEKGYDKTSMQDIVNALGMSKGAIFHHFRSKDEIFEAVMAKITDEQVVKYKDMLTNQMQHLNAREKLMSLTRRSLSENENIVSKMLITRIQDPKVTISMMKFNMDTSAPLLADVIREGIKDGSINTEYPDECAQVALLLLNVWCDPVIFECDKQTFRKRLEYLQFLMKVSGVDIISDELIEQNIKFTERLYEAKNEIN